MPDPDTAATATTARVTPAERIRWLRGSHYRVNWPVACCVKDHQNWPCDVIQALDAAAAEARAAERQRIRQGSGTYSTWHSGVRTSYYAVPADLLDADRQEPASST